jgi:hypothetical protein
VQKTLFGQARRPFAPARQTQLKFVEKQTAAYIDWSPHHLISADHEQQKQFLK